MFSQRSRPSRLHGAATRRRSRGPAARACATRSRTAGSSRGCCNSTSPGRPIALLRLPARDALERGIDPLQTVFGVADRSRWPSCARPPVPGAAPRPTGLASVPHAPADGPRAGFHHRDGQQPQQGQQPGQAPLQFAAQASTRVRPTSAGPCSCCAAACAGATSSRRACRPGAARHRLSRLPGAARLRGRRKASRWVRHWASAPASAAQSRQSPLRLGQHLVQGQRLGCGALQQCRHFGPALARLGLGVNQQGQACPTCGISNCCWPARSSTSASADTAWCCWRQPALQHHGQGQQGKGQVQGHARSRVPRPAVCAPTPQQAMRPTWGSRRAMRSGAWSRALRHGGHKARSGDIDRSPPEL
jgi:hypothetical protein